MTPVPLPKTSFDPGLTTQYAGPLMRTINKDGSLNIQRRGLSSIAGNAYLHLVNISWARFWGLIALAYLLVNTLFATGYFLLGPQALHASDRDLGLTELTRAFFFSVQTLTTVGYGALYPHGTAANVLAALEAACGLTGFAFATGLLFARFSRPSAKLVFSGGMVVAPYREGTSLQFRIANQRRNVLMEVQADMVLMTVEQGPDGQLKRNFVQLTLERKQVFFLALTWTVVHPIDESSPLWGKTHEDLEKLQAELLILIKGFDDTFSQVVHARYSYRWDEIDWSAKFVPAFYPAPEGHMVLDVSKVGEIVRV
jgi:inward rectifier potassium channel